MRTWLALFLLVSSALCAHLSFSAEHIHFTPARTGLEYAVLFPPDIFTATTSTVLFVEPESNSGERLILKGGSCDLPWSFQGRYVRLKQCAQEEVEGDLVSLLQAGAFVRVTTALSKYNNVLEALDLLFDYNFSTPCLSLRPFFGTKFARINEALSAQYLGGLGNVNVISNISQTLHGYGLQGGLEMSIAFFTQRLSFLSRASVALLQSCIKGTWQATPDLVASVPLAADFSNERDSVVRMFEIQVGLEFALVRLKCMSVELFGGYEMQGWQIPDFVLPFAERGEFIRRNQALLGWRGSFVGVRLLF